MARFVPVSLDEESLILLSETPTDSFVPVLLNEKSLFSLIPDGTLIVHLVVRNSDASFVPVLMNEQSLFSNGNANRSFHQERRQQAFVE